MISLKTALANAESDSTVRNRIDALFEALGESLDQVLDDHTLDLGDLPDMDEAHQEDAINNEVSNAVVDSTVTDMLTDILTEAINKRRNG